MTQWYSFTTAPQEEVESAKTLRDRDFEVIVLMHSHKKRAHRRHRQASVVVTSLPAWRSYLFVEMTASDAWARLHEAPVNMHPMYETIRVAGEWQRVPRKLRPHEVEYITNPLRGLYLDTDAPAVRCLDDNAPLDYGVGDCVKIQDGPFQGFEGPVASITGRQASVLLVLFAREVKATVSVGSAVRAVA
jgi:transcription antitermination factor NusG